MRNNKNFSIKNKPYLAILGILGVLGPLLYIETRNPSMLLLQLFFSLFALYWEAKLPKEVTNKNRLLANYKSGKWGFICIIIVLINASITEITKDSFIYLMICLPLVLSIQVIVRSYLSFKYENK